MTPRYTNSTPPRRPRPLTDPVQPRPRGLWPLGPLARAALAVGPLPLADPDQAAPVLSIRGAVNKDQIAPERIFIRETQSLEKTDSGLSEAKLSIK